MQIYQGLMEGKEKLAIVGLGYVGVLKNHLANNDTKGVVVDVIGDYSAQLTDLL